MTRAAGISIVISQSLAFLFVLLGLNYPASGLIAFSFFPALWLVIFDDDRPKRQHRPAQPKSAEPSANSGATGDQGASERRGSVSGFVPATAADDGEVFTV
ncbi:MAG: hypothetical protein KIT77_24085 [Caldilinea sp.]|nr:hypothetical protein [Caldilinea sp.]MCW5844352.1 hypothetical protein [Caldilinea sp.]